MINPKISVIVPVYKVEQYLSECIESILTQTFTDFELLLVDDGSPDLSGGICDEYAVKDNRIRVFHKLNGGVSSARNVGLDNARGEWVVFVDSDDWVEKEYFECILKIRNLNSYDVLHVGYIEFDLENNKTLKIPSKETQISKKDFFNREIFVGAIYAYVFKNQLINKQKMRFSEDIRIGEDMEFVTKYLLYSQLIFVSKLTMYNYRYNTESAFRTILTYSKIADNLIVVRNIYEYILCELQLHPSPCFMIKWYEISIRSYINQLICNSAIVGNEKCIELDMKSIMNMTKDVKFDIKHKFVFSVFSIYPQFTANLLQLRIELINRIK